jgi:hypothetical protein
LFLHRREHKIQSSNFVSAYQIQQKVDALYLLLATRASVALLLMLAFHGAFRRLRGSLGTGTRGVKRLRLAIFFIIGPIEPHFLNVRVAIPPC